MYIRITTVTYDVAKEQEVLQFVDEQMIPAMRQLPGFNGYTGSLDSAARRAVSITTWDDMDHAQGLRAALSGLVGQVEALGTRFDPAQIYEVVRQV